jgi:hypothetical protein
VEGAVNGNYRAVKGPEGAVISAKSCREDSAGPGNPDFGVSHGSDSGEDS